MIFVYKCKHCFLHVRHKVHIGTYFDKPNLKVVRSVKIKRFFKFLLPSENK